MEPGKHALEVMYLYMHTLIPPLSYITSPGIILGLG